MNIGEVQVITEEKSIEKLYFLWDRHFGKVVVDYVYRIVLYITSEQFPLQ